MHPLSIKIVVPQVSARLAAALVELAQQNSLVALPNAFFTPDGVRNFFADRAFAAAALNNVRVYDRPEQITKWDAHAPVRVEHTHAVEISCVMFAPQG